MVTACYSRLQVTTGYSSRLQARGYRRQVVTLQWHTPLCFNWQDWCTDMQLLWVLHACSKTKSGLLDTQQLMELTLTQLKRTSQSSIVLQNSFTLQMSIMELYLYSFLHDCNPFACAFHRCLGAKCLFFPRKKSWERD